MAELSAKEYWLLKEIEEEFRKSVHPRHLFYYIREILPWKEMSYLRWYNHDDELMYSMLFDVLTKHSDRLQVLLKTCDHFGLKHVEKLVKKMEMFQDLKMKTSTVVTKEAQGTEEPIKFAELSLELKDTTDIPLSSAAFENTKDKLACLCQLMMTVCADLFRDVLDYYIQPAQRKTELPRVCGYLISIMNNEQRRFMIIYMRLLLYRSYKGDAIPLITKDLSLLYILIRFSCNIPPPQTGWGSRPEDDDKSLAGCIERIRILGKAILDHSRKIKEIQQSDFKYIFRDLCTNISEIQKMVFKKESYAQAVDEFVSRDINLSERYIHDFKNLTSKENTISPFAVIQYYPARETENLFRVCTLIDTISSNLFRDTLFRFVNPTSLEFEGRLRSKDDDLLFCYNYLRKNCGITQHKCGWGFLPDTNDQSLAACIDRLMIQRNSIAASMKCGISESNFQEIWRKLRDDIIEIEQQVIGGNVYKKRVQNLFSMPINQVFAVEYVARNVHAVSFVHSSTDDSSEGMPEKSSLSMKSDDGETGIPEKPSLSMKPDDGETGEDCRSLPVLSTEQTELFKSIDKTIDQTFPKDSVVGDIFEEKGLTLVGREIKSLSEEVPVLQNPAIYQRTRGFKPGAVLILEVEVSKQNGEVKCTEKNTIFNESICNSKRDYNPRVILVKSKPELKEDAKSAVFQKYRDLIFMGNTFVQHETDDDLELSKLSAFYSVSFVCDQIQPMIKFKQNYIRNAVEILFSETNISSVSSGVILKDGDIEVGSKDHGSYFCNNEISVDLFRQNLELEAIRKICTAFGFDFYLRNNKRGPITETSLPFDIYGRILFQAVLANLPNDADRLHAKVTMPVDVNSRDWRQEVAKALSTSINGNICKIEERFEELCIETHNDLKRVCTQLELYKNRCHQNSINEHIIGCVKKERKQILKKIPSVLTYIVGKKHGISTIKIFLKVHDSKAEDYFRQAFDKHVIKFVNVSKTIQDSLEPPPPYESQPLMDKDIRKRLKEVIKRHSTALLTNHSHIFQISTGTMPDAKEGEKPCIVIHCFDKTLVPIGEQELPHQLEDYPIYIEEGIIMFGSCAGCQSLRKGCSIGQQGGSIGLFVTRRKNDKLKKETGFITAAHVALPTFEEFYSSNQLFSKQNIQDPYMIVHPSMLDNVISRETIGEVREAFCGTYVENGIGIDAAFVRTLKEIDVHNDLQIADEDNLTLDGNTRVMKSGSATSTTYGTLHNDDVITKLEICGVECCFKNVYSIRNSPEDNPCFFLPGDSGSAVYLIDKPNTVLGIGFAYMFDKKMRNHAYVCSIRTIVDAFDIDAT